MDNLCETCKFLKLQTTNYCLPYDYDEFGNVIRCQAYAPMKKNIIRQIIDFLKKND